MIGIYKITSPSGKIYIGSSNNIKNRVSTYKNLKCKSQTRLFNSLLKYGWDKHIFEIIENCDISVLLQRELYYGTFFNVLSINGLNCRLPKSEDNYLYMCEETKQKISKANKGKAIGRKVGFYKSKLKSLSIEEVVEIKKLLIENKLTQLEIANLFKSSRKIINNINLKKTYKDIGEDIDLAKSKKQYIKLNKEDYDKIKKLYEEGLNQTKIAKQFKVDPSHISRIISNERYIKSLN